MQTVLYAAFGYLSGSVLYAKVFTKIFQMNDAIEQSRDKNPGTANAFQYGGFWCGFLTLAGDLLKGFIPVFLFTLCAKQNWYSQSLAGLVIASPVIGHAFPLFYRFQGGKGVAVSFGCLLGLFPCWQPAAVLAFFFLLFSLVLRISPHFYRTIVAYLCSVIGMVCMTDSTAVRFGFFLISGIVFIRLFLSKEEKESMRVKMLWMH